MTDPAIEAATDAILAWERAAWGDDARTQAMTELDAYHKAIRNVVVAAVRPIVIRECAAAIDSLDRCDCEKGDFYDGWYAGRRLAVHEVLESSAVRGLAGEAK